MDERNGRQQGVLMTVPFFRIWLCGTFRVERCIGTTYEAIRTVEWGGSSYPRLLLKALLCRPGRQARREALMELLWPDCEPEQAVQNLNTAITKLRSVLRPTKEQESLLHTENDATMYRLEGQDQLWVDADAALALLKQAERLDRTSAETLSLLEEAESYFSQGPFQQDEEGQWVAGRRATVEQARYRCRLWLVEAYEQQRMPGQAATVLSPLLEEDPFDEDVLCRLMALLHRQGMTHQAIRLYERSFQVFAQEGMEPTEATGRLVERLRENHQHTSQAANASLLLLPGSIIPREGISELKDKDMDKLRRKLLRDLLNTSGITLALSPHAFLDVEVLERLTSALKAPSSIDPTALAVLETITGDKRQDFVHLEGATWYELLYEVSGHLNIITQLLERSQPTHMYIRLCLVAGETALLMGDILFNAGNSSIAEKYYDIAFQAAQEAQDDVLQAVILGRKSFVFIYDHSPQHALPLLEEAHRLTEKKAADIICSWLWAIQGEAYANMRDATATLDTLAHAKDILERGSPGKISYAFGENVAYALHSPLKFLGFRGACLLRLKQSQEAQFVLNDYLNSLEALGKSAQNHHKSIALADIALSYVQQTSVKKAFEYASLSLSYIEQTKSSRVFQRVLSVRRTLNPWGDSPYVKELDRQITTVLPLLIQ